MTIINILVTLVIILGIYGIVISLKKIKNNDPINAQIVIIVLLCLGGIYGILNLLN